MNNGQNDNEEHIDFTGSAFRKKYISVLRNSSKIKAFKKRSLTKILHYSTSTSRSIQAFFYENSETVHFALPCVFETWWKISRFFQWNHFWSQILLLQSYLKAGDCDCCTQLLCFHLYHTVFMTGLVMLLIPKFLILIYFDIADSGTRGIVDYNADNLK